MKQFKPTTDEEWVIRSLLNAQEAFVIDTDFVIEEDPDGEPHAISELIEGGLLLVETV